MGQEQQARRILAIGGAWDYGRMGLRGSFWYAVISAHPSTLGRVTGADAQGPGWGHHDSSNGSLLLEGTRIGVVDGLAHANGSHPKRVPTCDQGDGVGARCSRV